MKLIISICLALFLASATCENGQSKTSGGIPQALAVPEVGPSGMTVEQENVKRRIEEDNKPGSVKYLYVISAYSGEVLLQSTVKGKVTSGEKRLEPSQELHYQGYPASDRIQPDGTYGSSVDYVYWWDVQGVYHQHYVSGGQILHVSSQPIAFGRVTIDFQQQ